MTSKTIIRTSIFGILAVAALAFSLTSFNAAVHASNTTCKESLDGCCQKKEGQQTGAGIGLETITNKFFSSVSY